MTGDVQDPPHPTDPPLPTSGALRWRGAERAAPEDLVDTLCSNCSQAWLVHRDMSGFRIRCRCLAMILVPRVAQPPAQTIDRPAADHNQPPMALDRRPGHPRLTRDSDDPPELSVAASVRGVNRIWVQMILILAAILGPQLFVIFLHPGSDSSRWWPYAGLASGVLITLVGMIWPRTAFAALRRPSAAAMIVAVMLGVGLAEAALVYIHLLGTEGSLDGLREEAGLPRMLFVIAVCPAVIEELAFRGLVQGSLTELWGQRLGWVMTAGIFALCHGPTLGLPCQLSLGLLLGWMRIRSGSLFPGMAMHGCYNGILVWAAYG